MCIRDRGCSGLCASDALRAGRPRPDRAPALRESLSRTWRPPHEPCSCPVSYTHLDVYKRQSDISAVLTRLNAERAELANGVDNEHPALVAFMKYKNLEALNREILVELVDYIKAVSYTHLLPATGRSNGSAGNTASRQRRLQSRARLRLGKLPQPRND